MSARFDFSALRRYPPRDAAKPRPLLMLALILLPLANVASGLLLEAWVLPEAEFWMSGNLTDFMMLIVAGLGACGMCWEWGRERAAAPDAKGA
ncbi:MAG: hypothetical protein GKS06_09610 [Acidobacteria bacterium]|nr:hypothetical protein [Acidobacteriota bacterium]